MESTSRIILALLLIFYATTVLSHSYVTSPTSRSNQKATESGCRGPACLGPCDVTFAQSRTPAVTIARGAPITVQWPRNNHAGGFIRIAWALTSGSDVHANFDAGVQTIVCHENGGCYPDSPSNPNGGDSGPGDGSSRACSTTITVPLNLADGAWTLQWAWFGGAFALGDYYSCVDYKISGGPTGSKVDAVFVGGDYTYPGQNKCKFFNTDRLHQCVNEPCNNPLYPNSQEQSGPAYMGAIKSSTTTSTSTSTSSSGRLTTAKPAAITSGSVVIPSSTTSATTTTGSNGGSANCAGLTQQVSSVAFAITSFDSWSGYVRVVVTVTVSVNINNWMVEVLLPSAANSQITAIYNAGVLKCSASNPVAHAMISPASWAVNLYAGSSYSIEFTATNSMNAADFKNSIKFAMFK